MAAECFLDTNILLYAYDLDAPEKRAVAARLLERAWREPGSSAISVQVLQEFFVNFIRKGQPEAEARALIADFCHWPVIENTVTLFGAALALRERWQLSLWDAAILAAAEASGAAQLYTEDLNHGQHYGPVQAINPFR
ncbi:MAG: PIN domain-containing protein [Opitutales bacterium]